ncbi:hypothetical protein LINPERHAP1_LOCUS24560 [Linum perenne]
MVKFANDQDYFKALTGGPWMILDHYLIVHQWDHSFRVSNDMPKKMVAWVRLPHAQVLTSLGNLVGRTIKIDFNTQRAERGKFARLAIELDLCEPLPPMVMIDGVPQLIKYESIPTLYFDCGRIGHDSKSCPLAPLATPLPITAPQPHLAVVSSSSLSAPAPEQYGPWMVVTRRQGRPKRETILVMEGVVPQVDSASGSKGDLASRKERKDHGEEPKSQRRSAEGSLVINGNGPYGAEKYSSSANPPPEQKANSGAPSGTTGLTACTKPKTKTKARVKRKRKDMSNSNQADLMWTELGQLLWSSLLVGREALMGRRLLR